MRDRIRHTTGHRPVAPSIRVRVWYDDPSLPTPERAEGMAGAFNWRISGAGEDIAFYQVVFTGNDEAHKGQEINGIPLSLLVGDGDAMKKAPVTEDDMDPLGRGRVKVPFAYCCSMDPATCDCVSPDHGHAWRLADVPSLIE